MAEHPPDFLTIEEARAVLNIGRTMAYREAAIYIATDGAQGMVPAIELKPKVLRVPRLALEELLGGPLTWPPPQRTRQPVTTIAPTMARPPRRKRQPTRNAKPAAAEQTSLPFTA